MNIQNKVLYLNIQKSGNMKATQLTPKQIKKIIYALELTFGDISNLDKSALKLAKQISEAKALITAK